MKESSPQRLREHRGAGFKPRYPKNDSVLSVSLTTLRSVHVRCATIVVEIHFSDFSDSLLGQNLFVFIFKIKLAHTFFVAHGFDFLAQNLTKTDRIRNRRNGDLWKRAIRGFEI